MVVLVVAGMKDSVLEGLLTREAFHLSEKLELICSFGAGLTGTCYPSRPFTNAYSCVTKLIVNMLNLDDIITVFPYL